jgi:predicted aminopeptidase
MERWNDYQAFSSFLDGFVGDLTTIYGTPELSVEEKVQARGDLLVEYRTRYGEGTTYEASPLVHGFLARPLNNATLLARMRYFHRLPDFQALLDQHDGDLRAGVAAIAGGVKKLKDPFDVLPTGG